MPRKYISPAESFASNVDRSAGPDGCHLWTGKTEKGYGRLTRDKATGKKELAHRYAWRQRHGPIPPGVCILHRCDVRACANDRHLFDGTRKDNNEDRDRKGRHVALRGQANGNSKLRQDEALEIYRARGSETGAQLAERFDVSESLVYGIWNGVQWGWLTGAEV